MYITCCMVASVDGIAARSTTDKIDWSSPEDKKAFSQITKEIGTVIMGRTTFEAVGRALPGRLNIILTSTPEKFQGQEKKDVLEFLAGSPAAVVEALENRGITRAALIGGPHTNAAFFEAGLVNELFLTLEPKLFGAGLRWIEGQKIASQLVLTSTRQLTADVIQLHYQVKNP